MGAATQTLIFEHGIVRKTFLIAINNDNEPELDETFQLVLSEPTDGSSLGNQFITQVTILDDEKHVDSRISHWNSSIVVDTLAYPAGESAHFDVITRNYKGDIIAADSGESLTIQVINRVCVSSCFFIHSLSTRCFVSSCSSAKSMEC
jgi:hypothetical protein